MDVPGRPMNEVEMALAREKLQGEIASLRAEQGVQSTRLGDGLAIAKYQVEPPSEPPPGMTLAAEIKTLRERVFSLEQQNANLLQRLVRLEQLIGV